jgi:hypothetical protein|tara:strand:- start:931 stop:1458 length:528 start_codon:yes stop_codon:yes gene_type:complete
MNWKNNLYFFLILLIFSILNGCKFYSFTGASIPAGTKTFQVNFFENLAGNRPGSIVEPGLDQEFTIALQDLLLNQTNLSIVNKGGDLLYEGEIVEFSVTPMSATSQIKAAQNRLTMEINFRYFNKKNEDDDFEKRFSHFYDFPANQQVYDVRDIALDEIFERITQNIFNETLAKW